MPLATYINDTIYQKIMHSELLSYIDFMLNEIEPLWAFRVINARVERVIVETRDCKTFILRPCYLWGTSFQPGSHVLLTCSIRGVKTQRCYSISSSPQQFIKNKTVNITVKKQDKGKMSNWLHESLRWGDVVQISKPKGEFLLPEQPGPIIFMAAGSGITPIMSMIRSLLELGDSAGSSQDIKLLYYGNEPKNTIFFDLLQRYSFENKYFGFNFISTKEQGYVSEDHLRKYCEDFDKRKIYVCGPGNFKDKSLSLLKANNIEESNIITEDFRVRSISNKQYKPGTVTFTTSNLRIKNREKKTILTLAEEQGLNPRFGCRQGICKSCQCLKKTGTTFNTRNQSWQNEENEVIQACTSIPVGNVDIAL